ncbi:SRPBCC family protein [Nocardioides euryhalodurans]|uniref:Polyketide cyclase n=1 Tax=Nocardioides euryhalodurans TaxID=2518370 RepID=A0A4V1BDT5_9ACTN|nr:SRPBCC family protein [Nocardioides euryhalodurans]QBR92242.1 polyketide cyclase [Nocardioides euryhalodurans]
MMIQRTVETQAAPAAVFDYLSDFTRTTEWDPGTVSTVRVEGDGGVGTVYDNVSEFNGRKTELRYTVVDHVPHALVRLRGENKTVTAIDTMEIAAVGDGSSVTYTADFTFKGVAKLVTPFLGGAFKKLGDEAEQGLREALAKL